MSSVQVELYGYSFSKVYGNYMAKIDICSRRELKLRPYICTRVLTVTFDFFYILIHVSLNKKHLKYYKCNKCLLFVSTLSHLFVINATKLLTFVSFFLNLTYNLQHCVK